jgi:ADP-ribose pyrophosphatase YjhB (NUDIX family)
MADNKDCVFIHFLCGDELLVCRDNENGLYCVAGGHLKDGESIINGLRRELKEESGLTFSGIEDSILNARWYKVENPDHCVYQCVARIPNKESLAPIDTRESSGWGWLKLTDLTEEETKQGLYKFRSHLAWNV